MEQVDNRSQKMIGLGIVLFGFLFTLWSWNADPLHGLGQWLDLLSRSPGEVVDDAGDGLIVVGFAVQLVCGVLGSVVLAKPLKGSHLTQPINVLLLWLAYLTLPYAITLLIHLPFALR